ncbi:hypothetical protein PIB30_054917 [Stylosanthes scabra]|uniref:Uncharacterized protein n=1 Tax=Stylosanthes scabra TaxID=79078 RepID=A0ABU6UJS4_9FABA|nr:hypothetical protein [Stylosanthes scabra]
MITVAGFGSLLISETCSATVAFGLSTGTNSTVFYSVLGSPAARLLFIAGASMRLLFSLTTLPRKGKLLQQLRS